MSLLAARVNGIPGPKGSVNAICLRCAKRGLKSAVIIKEQSETGVVFRKKVGRQLKAWLITNRINEIYSGPVETILTFYVHRQKVVRAGVEQDGWVPSHQSPVPTHRGSGDVEKHVRNIHDALMDAGVIADDSQVWRTVAEKVWADEGNPPGVMITIRELQK